MRADMHPEERCLIVKKADLIEVLRALEIIVASLDRIGACYAELESDAYHKVTGEFIEEWDICSKLLQARKILSDYFPNDLGEDDMGELERALHDTPHWQRSCPKPPKGNGRS